MPFPAQMLSAFRSKDPNRQVGACIVDPNTHRIVGIGYNGFPLGCPDDELPWARDAESWLDTKHPYVCHAEMNAIFNKVCRHAGGRGGVARLGRAPGRAG